MFERSREWLRNELIDSGEGTHVTEVRRDEPNAGIDTNPISEEDALAIGKRNFRNTSLKWAAIYGAALAVALSVHLDRSNDAAPQGQTTPLPSHIELK